MSKAVDNQLRNKWLNAHERRLLVELRREKND